MRWLEWSQESAANKALLIEHVEEATRHVDVVAAVRIIATRESEGAQWQAYFARIDITRRADAPQATSLSYRQGVRLLSETMGGHDFAARLRGTVLGSRGFTCEDIEVDAEAFKSTWFPKLLSSENDYCPWPCLELRCQSKGSWDSSRRGPLASAAPEHPFHSSVDQLVEAVAAVERWGSPSDPRLQAINIIAWDYRARIRDVTRTPEGLAVGLDALDVKDLTILGRARGPAGVHQLRAAATTAIVFPMPARCHHLNLVVVAGEDTVIDEREYSQSWESSAEILRPVGEAPQVDALLADGENLHVEFKPWILPKSDGKLSELLATAVAFANTEGGHILVGVDDSGTPHSAKAAIGKFLAAADAGGSIERESRDSRVVRAVRAYGISLRDQVQQAVNRPLDIKISVAEVVGFPVLVMQVAEGSVKPYLLVAANDMFIRRSATTRRPSEAEQRALLE